MKKLKNIFKLALMIIIPIVMLMGNQSKAAGETKYFMLFLKSTVKRPVVSNVTVLTTGDINFPVIKIVETNSSGVQQNADGIYCLNNTKGFASSATSTGTSGTTDNRNPRYTQLFEMHETVPSSYSNYMESSVSYGSLLWLLDNLCDPTDETTRETLIQNALEWASVGDKYYSGIFKTYAQNGESGADVEKDIIEIVQQAAIWHITNPGSRQPSVAGSFNLGGRTAKEIDGTNWNGERTTYNTI